MLRELRSRDITETVLDDIKQGKAAKHGITRLADGTLVQLKNKHMRVAPSATVAANHSIEPRLMYDTKANVKRRRPDLFDESMYCMRCDQLLFGACMYIPRSTTLDQQLSAHATATAATLSLSQLSCRHCIDCFLYHVCSDERLSLALASEEGWNLTVDLSRRMEVFKYLIRLDRGCVDIEPLFQAADPSIDVYYQ